METPSPRALAASDLAAASAAAVDGTELSEEERAAVKQALATAADIGAQSGR